MASKKIVLGIGPIVDQTSWQKLGEWAELRVYEYPQGTPEDFLQKLESGFFGSVNAIYKSNESTKITGRFDAEVVDRLPPSTKFICHCGAGYDNIDVTACTSRGIQVSNAPHTTDDAVADQAIFLMIGALRRAQPTMDALRAGQWRGPGPLSWGHDPEGKTLGIIGMGSIGQTIAKRALAFEMRLIYHNRHRLDAETENNLGGAQYVEMDELLASADVISLSMAYTPDAHHFLGKAEFAKMKKGVTIVNTARGQMIDEEALVAALDEGIVWSAGLDVFEEEPAAHSKLLQDKRVFLSPHSAAGTIETYFKMERKAYANVESAITRGVLVSQVPDQKAHH